MRKIINTATGAHLGVTEKWPFVRLYGGKTDYVDDAAEAAGVTYKGTLYNLEGTEGVGAEETVRVEEYDAGDDTLATAARAAELENALCELDEELHGGE